MIYLIEPYNAHQKPPRKKHWMEIAEEEALHHRIMMEAEARNQILQQAIHEQAIQEHMALREANALLNSQNLALPQYAPQPSSQQVQDGQYASPAGGGGWISDAALEPYEVADFSATPSVGFGPLSVSFSNLMPTPDNDTFFWSFGTGSLTSILVRPVPVVYNQTGSYTASLQATSSTGNKSSVSRIITVNLPSLFAWMSGPLVLTGIAPISKSFTQPTQTYNGGGVVTGTWIFGDGTTAAYTNSVDFYHVYNTGSFTASLQLTESGYNLTSTAITYVSLSVPTLTANFTFISSSDSGPGFENFVPMTASLSSSTTYNGNGTFNSIKWFIKTGSVTVSQSVGVSPTTYITYIYTPGDYTASLQVTESSYNLTSLKNQPFIVTT